MDLFADDLSPPGTENDLQALSVSAGAANASAFTSLISKKDSEIERLLAVKAYLPPKHDKLGNVFECIKDKWYCHVCLCPVMGQVFNHENGRRHTSAMEAAKARWGYVPDARTACVDDAKHASDAAPPTDLHIAPGEPVPPGFENEVSKVAQIQERLDNFKTSCLIGLEYLVELQDYDQDREPTYSCLLCGKKGDSRTIIPHLMSHKHVECYVQRHFPTVYNSLARFCHQRKFRKPRTDTLTKIAEAIEHTYGRMRPLPVDASTFEGCEQEIYTKVIKGPHFSELSGNTFENLVDVDEIIRLASDECESGVQFSPELMQSANIKAMSEVTKRRASLSPVSSISSDELASDNVTRGREKKTMDRETTERRDREKGKERDREKDRYRERDRARDRALYNRRGQRSPPPRTASLPWHDPEYRKKRNATAATIPPPTGGGKSESKRDEFRRLSLLIEKDKERILRQHRLNPEKHPQYNDEWKCFWNHRYKELQAEGADVANHDFKPEWIVFWSKRMEELHRDDVKKDVDCLRKRLGLPEVAPISFRIGMSSAVKPIAAQPDQDHEVIVIDDQDERDDDDDECRDRRRDRERKRSSRRSRSKSPSRSRYRRRTRSRSHSHSPWEESPGSRRRSATQRRRSRSRSLRSRSRSRSRGTSSSNARRTIAAPDLKKKSDVLVPNDLPFSTGSILMRESQLKKKEQEEALLAMDVNIISVLRLLTALEDLLGILGPKIVDLLAKALAMEKREPNSAENLLDDEDVCTIMETTKEKLKGLLHSNLVGFAQERAVKGSVTKIAALLYQHQQDVQKQREEKEKLELLEKINKAEIAKQISTALVLQGKTDVTQEELVQLVNMIVDRAAALKRASSDVNAGLMELKEKKATTQATNSRTETTPKLRDEDTEKEDADSSSGVMDGLSDLELQALLQSFKDLSSEEQHGLITYLKKLEAKEPERVETLRKFVNLSNSEGTSDGDGAADEAASSGKVSPFSQKLKQNQSAPKASMQIAENTKNEKAIDSDEDDYTYEDIFKAASKNLQSAENTKMTAVAANLHQASVSNEMKDGSAEFIAKIMKQNENILPGMNSVFAPGGALSKMTQNTESYRNQQFNNSRLYQTRQIPGFSQFGGNNNTPPVNYAGFAAVKQSEVPLGGNSAMTYFHMNDDSHTNQANMNRRAPQNHPGSMGCNGHMNYNNFNRWF